MNVFAMLFSLLVATDAGAPPARENCDAIYDGLGQPKDYGRALKCYRASQNWMMVAIMQLNGEGTRVDIVGARASLDAAQDLEEKGLSPEQSGDLDELDKIITAREKHPKAKAPRITCRDVATVTVSQNECEARERGREVAAQTERLTKVRARLEPAARAPFDKMAASFVLFHDAEHHRAYQEYVDGSIRNQWAMWQQALLRKNFDAIVKIVAGDLSSVPTAARSLADADAELNAVYREKVRSYAAFHEDSAANARDPSMAATDRQAIKEFRETSRASQRTWIVYRDAAAKLAGVRWPKVSGIEDVVRALITEDRILELKETLGG